MSRLTLNHLKFLIQSKPCIEKELHSNRTISFVGEKRTFAAVQSKNATRHSYT